MIPPRGFKAEMYPLRHRIAYAFGLGALTDTSNSTIMTFVKNYKQSVKADTITTNPHNPNLDVETGAICNKMSIIDKLSISMHFTLTEDALADGIESLKVMYMPIFTVFGEKLDSVDTVTTTTAAAVLELTKDATAEDITPAFGTKLFTAAGNADKNHPVSSVNFTEVFGTLNLTTNVAMEAVPFFNLTLQRALKYYTNKGAIRSMIGRMRWITLTKQRPTVSIYIRKFVPRAVRRILPYSFFGMLVHTPIDSDSEAPYWTGAVTTSKVHVGVKCLVNYHEWNIDNIQEMETT